ncbi:MAG: serine/threonine-protein kinase, partial [Myxococcota bacterium]|nr:serine/threonine-protein kinase [Myxococcota bacterium]
MDTTRETLDGSRESLRETVAGPTQILRSLGVKLPQARTDPNLTVDLSQGGDKALSGEHDCPHGPIGRFLPMGEIGRGGMGRVLAARDPELGRTVALKVLLDPDQVSEEQLQRFVAEARITSQLEHPNIVPVHDFGVTPEGQLYFVMKRVEGRSLHSVLSALRDGDSEETALWTRHRLLTAFIQVCNAVAYAHEQGVLHRDIKPDNVMLGRFGQVLLMDWGVARVLDSLAEESNDPSTSITSSVSSSTLVGTTIGTPGYMSPEQANGQLTQLGPHSDVWSLGAVLYELLTYQSAFVASTPLKLLFEAARSEPPDPRVRAPERDIPDEIAEVCLKALSATAAERFTSALELAEAIEAFLEGSRRKEAAAGHVAAADRAWGQYRKLQQERSSLEERVRVLAKAVPGWASLEEKADLLQTRDRLEEVSRERVDLFEEVVSSCEKALSQDPGNPGGRSLLAQVHYARFEEAEASGDVETMRGAERRILRYDDGSMAPLVRGTGALTLRTDPPGVEVLCQEVQREGLIWSLGPPRSLGRSPLIRIPLEKG